METWKTIDEETNYQVSDKGCVKNISTGHLKSLRLDKYGYLRVTLYPSGKTYSVHRLVASAFVENVESYQQVNHINGNKKDNTKNNLEWYTPKRNTQHAWDTGLCKPQNGELNPTSKLVNRDVLFIRESKESTKSLASKFGVGCETVRRVKKRILWKHI